MMVLGPLTQEDEYFVTEMTMLFKSEVIIKSCKLSAKKIDLHHCHVCLKHHC
jgi:hypothetical protein